MSYPGVHAPRVSLTTEVVFLGKEIFEQPNNIMSHVDLIFRQLHLVTEIDCNF